MSRLTLYHTAGCHLCEEAQALILDCLARRGIGQDALELADIAEDAALLERYGLSIPVLRNQETGRELGWPFGQAEIQGSL
jgi:hypothetical protein